MAGDPVPPGRDPARRRRSCRRSTARGRGGAHRGDGRRSRRRRRTGAAASRTLDPAEAAAGGAGSRPPPTLSASPLELPAGLAGDRLLAGVAAWVARIGGEPALRPRLRATPRIAAAAAPGYVAGWVPVRFDAGGRDFGAAAAAFATELDAGAPPGTPSPSTSSARDPAIAADRPPPTSASRSRRTRDPRRLRHRRRRRRRRRRPDLRRRRLSDGAAAALAEPRSASCSTAVADGSAEATCRSTVLPVMAAAERARAARRLERHRAPPTTDRCMHTLIEAQAARTPDATAVVFEAEALTYAELDARANRVAQRAARRWASVPTRSSACYMPRSLEMIVGALAIHKAGGAYVPLDPGYPRRPHRPLSRRQRRAGGPHPVRRRAPPAGAATRRCSSSTPTRGSPPRRQTPVDARRRPGEPRLRHLHLGLDRHAQGRDDRAPQRRELLRRHGRAHRRAEPRRLAGGHQPLLRHLGARALLDAGPRLHGRALRRREPRARLERPARGQRPADRLQPVLLGQRRRRRPAQVRAAARRREVRRRATASPRSGRPSATSTPSAAPTRTPRSPAPPSPRSRRTSASAPAAASRRCTTPARIAEEWAVIDNLTNGRAALAIASGWQPDDFVLRPENTPPANKAAMIEAIDTLRRLWRGEAVEFPTAVGQAVRGRHPAAPGLGRAADLGDHRRQPRHLEGGRRARRQRADPPARADDRGGRRQDRALPRGAARRRPRSGATTRSR